MVTHWQDVLSLILVTLLRPSALAFRMQCTKTKLWSVIEITQIEANFLGEGDVKVSKLKKSRKTMFGHVRHWMKRLKYTNHPWLTCMYVSCLLKICIKLPPPCFLETPAPEPAQLNTAKDSSVRCFQWPANTIYIYSHRYIFFFEPYVF